VWQFLAACLVTAAVILCPDRAAAAISFQPPITSDRPVPVALHGVSGTPLIAADWDGDGRLDLTVITESGFSMLYGNGDGTFAAPVDYPVGGRLQEGTAADVNGDGRLDLALCHFSLGKLLVMLNRGGRSFAPPANYPVGSLPVSVAAADFNGDSAVDLAVSNHGSHNLAVLLNRGDGTFSPAVFYGGISHPGGVISADFDRDGKIDLAQTSLTENVVRILRGDGAGQFTVSGRFPTDEDYANRLVTDDLNGDGLLDLAVASLGNYSILFGDGSGQFSRPTRYDGYHLIDVGDLDGDGDPDLVTPGADRGGFFVHRNHAGGNFLPPMAVPGPGGKTGSIRLGDFNADGRPDVVAWNEGSPHLALFLNNAPRSPAPATPTGLTARAVSAGQIALSWIDNSRDETGFSIDRREGSGPWTRIALVAANVTRFADLNVRPGTTYTYRVQAVSDRGTSAWSNEASITLAPEPPPASAPPAAPTNLAAERVFATQIDLRWQDNSSNEQQFILWRRAGAGDFVWIGSVGANVTTFSDTGLQPRTTYTYLVRAWNSVGASRDSNELTVQTPSSDGVAPLPAPTALSAAVLSLTEIRLTWRDNSSDEHAFALFRRTATSDWTRIAVLTPNTTHFLDQKVTPGTTHTYRVRATRDNVASDWSNEVSVATTRIDGVPHVVSPARETLAATFTRPDGGVTAGAYQGYVLLHVTGVGQAYGATFNDAFYLFTSPFSSPRNGHDGGYYQLTFGTSPLQAFSLGSNARNFLVGPLPAYNPAHEYTFVLDTRLVSPGRLHFGVSDGGYNDNTGAYTITVTQLVPVS
jgi:hypothetical protein